MVCKMYDPYRISFKGVLPVTGGNVFYSLENQITTGFICNYF